MRVCVCTCRRTFLRSQDIMSYLQIFPFKKVNPRIKEQVRTRFDFRLSLPPDLTPFTC